MKISSSLDTKGVLFSTTAEDKIPKRKKSTKKAVTENEQEKLCATYAAQKQSQDM